jgi:hypothetical protein
MVDVEARVGLYIGLVKIDRFVFLSETCGGGVRKMTAKLIQKLINGGYINSIFSNIGRALVSLNNQ